jgi:eukaryotic-like serine/threonine-protein kinase
MESILAPGEVTGLRDYEILTKIAEGSMASVYKGRHRASGELVALKIPLPSVADNEVLQERFRREFKAGKSLNHPNIVRALDFGQEGSSCYLVMEYVDGPDLWERIEQEGRLPEKEAIAIISQVAQGLHEAHKHGIIHRDVKPDNVLLDQFGQAKLADLGLIKDLEGDFNLTCPHKGLGTPNFMAPEQFTEARHADVRCDVYSLGATLYMAVTGTIPFQAKSVAALLRKKLSNDLTPPRDIVPGLSEAVDWTIRRAVQVDAERRHATCLEFVRALNGEEVMETVEVPRGKRQRPSEERRRSVRYACTIATLCELRASIHPGTATPPDQWDSKVLNLSVSGIGLLLQRRFEPGTRLTILLESPDHRFQHRAEITVVRNIRVADRQWYMGAVFGQPIDKVDLRKLL